MSLLKIALHQEQTTRGQGTHFSRRTKKRALETHTTVQSKITDSVTVQNIISQCQVDVAPSNVESQPFQVETLSPTSDFQMEEVDLL